MQSTPEAAMSRLGFGLTVHIFCPVPVVCYILLRQNLFWPEIALFWVLFRFLLSQGGSRRY